MTLSILLVGYGKMGSALLTRWRQHPPANVSRFFVIEPTEGHHLSDVEYFSDLASLSAECHPDIVIFAVKPQQLESIISSYRERFGHAPLYLSIAAGKTINFFTTRLGKQAHVVRAMPNAAALIGQGVTALCATTLLSASHKHLATQLMQAVGYVEWLDDESLMDAVTALSGSGPAYVFLFLDALTKAGINAGLSATLAKSLALKTAAGSCALALQREESLEKLRQNVTSPGGTTEAALRVLMRDQVLEKLIDEAVKNAILRSKKLSK